MEMKKYILILIIVLLICPIKINAQRGCCSHHGGVSGCSSGGKQICNDGSLSPTCTCTPTVTTIYGCTDSKAKNYNSSANKDNGSCEYYVYGCTDTSAINYNSSAEKDDGSCEYNTEIEDIDEENKTINAVSNDVDYESDSGRKNNESQEESSDGAAGILVFSVGAAILGRYLYKKKKKH